MGRRELSAVSAPAGLLTLGSRFGTAQTMGRLVDSVTSRGLEVFARIDHGAGAAAVWLPLRPTELLIFGNARGGTPIMQAAQTAGIDLPLKALVWQDDGGAAWIGWNDPGWIASRHGLAPDSVGVDTLRKALSEIAHEAAGHSI